LPSEGTCRLSTVHVGLGPLRTLIRHVNRAKPWTRQREGLQVYPGDHEADALETRTTAYKSALEKGDISPDDVVTHGNGSSIPSAIVEAFYRISRSLVSNFTAATFFPPQDVTPIRPLFFQVESDQEIDLEPFFLDPRFVLS